MLLMGVLQTRSELVAAAEAQLLVKGREVPCAHQVGPHKAAVVLWTLKVATPLGAAVILAHRFVVLRWAAAGPPAEGGWLARVRQRASKAFQCTQTYLKYLFRSAMARCCGEPWTAVVHAGPLAPPPCPLPPAALDSTPPACPPGLTCTPTHQPSGRPSTRPTYRTTPRRPPSTSQRAPTSIPAASSAPVASSAGDCAAAAGPACGACNWAMRNFNEQSWAAVSTTGGAAGCRQPQTGPAPAGRRRWVPHSALVAPW